MNVKPLYQALASLIQARANCIASANVEWRDKHEEKAEQIVADFMPSGSGWDNGTKLDFDESTSEKLVFRGAYHHMDAHGGYDGWTEHSVTVRPSLTNDFTITLSGRDRNDIKEYLRELFDVCLRQEIEQRKDAPYRYALARKEAQ